MSIIENLGYIAIAVIPLLIFIDCFILVLRTRHRRRKLQGYTAGDRRGDRRSEDYTGEDRRMKEDRRRIAHSHSKSI